MGILVPEKCSEHRLEIEEQIPVLDIIQIITDSLGQIGVATKAVYLRPAGNARLNRMTSVVMWDLVFKVPDQLRTFRARSHQTHFAFEHIPELRDLVDVPLPHKCANSKPARVVFLGPSDFPVFFRVEPHTANLQHVESLAIPAEPPLAIE